MNRDQLISPAVTGYSDRHYKFVGADVPMGIGKNGGPRVRLAILAYTAPAWQRAAWNALPAGAVVPCRVIAMVGRARAAVVLTADSMAGLNAQMAAYQAASAARQAAKCAAANARVYAAAKRVSDLHGLLYEQADVVADFDSYQASVTGLLPDGRWVVADLRGPAFGMASDTWSDADIYRLVQFKDTA